MSQPSTVSIFAEAPETAVTQPSPFEPGFAQSHALHPEVADAQWCEQWLKQLERQLLRTPSNLTLHLQRINALMDAGLGADRLYAAVLDLHAVLGNNGMALQQRIHQQVFNELDDAQRTALVALRSGSSPTGHPAESYCLMYGKDQGSVVLVEKGHEAGADKSVPVDFNVG